MLKLKLIFTGLVILLIGATNWSNAQNYSLGVDIMPLFKNNKGAGVIFKKIQEKDNLRALVSTSFGTSNSDQVSGKRFSLGMGVGYERKKMINNFVLAVGSDVVYNHNSSQSKRTSIGIDTEQKVSSNGIGLAPFAGLSYLFQESFSVGLESSALIQFVKSNEESNIDPSDMESVDWSGIDMQFFNNFRLYLAYRF